MKYSGVVPVSVIIPCFNCASTLERAVVSVYNQSVLPTELVLVDDASCDDSGAVINRLIGRYGADWVRVITLPVNGGAANARNTGWEKATQPYIAFLDSDDSWHPRKLEIQYAWMQSHPQVALTGHHRVWLKPGVHVPEIPGEWQVWPVGGRQLLLSNRFSTPTVMLRRDLPYRFDSGKRHSEDYLLWLRVALGGHSIQRLELPLAYIYKAPYGEGGLSVNLWEMEKDELDNYNRLRNSGLISGIECLFLKAYAFIRFLRRLAIRKYKTTVVD